jgi:hypothetical protein
MQRIASHTGEKGDEVRGRNETTLLFFFIGF